MVRIILFKSPLKSPAAPMVIFGKLPIPPVCPAPPALSLTVTLAPFTNVEPLITISCPVVLVIVIERTSVSSKSSNCAASISFTIKLVSSLMVTVAAVLPPAPPYVTASTLVGRRGAVVLNINCASSVTASTETKIVSVFGRPFVPLSGVDTTTRLSSTSYSVTLTLTLKFS